MKFVPGTTWRISKRGLVVCESDGTTLLVDHERAAELPALIDEAGNFAELSGLLGGSKSDRQLVSDLIAARIVTDPATLLVRDPVRLKWSQVGAQSHQQGLTIGVPGRQWVRHFLVMISPTALAPAPLRAVGCRWVVAPPPRPGRDVPPHPAA